LVRSCIAIQREELWPQRSRAQHYGRSELDQRTPRRAVWREFPEYPQQEIQRRENLPLYASNAGFMENSGQGVLPADISEDFLTPYVDAQMAVLGTISQIDSTYFVEANGDPFSAPHIPRREFISNEFESYIQDQWRVTPTLTLTAGLRYSYATPPYEKNGLQVRPTLDIHGWFEERRDGGASGVPSNQNPLISFVPAGKANDQPTFFDPDKNNFAPRIALAWAPSFSSGPFHALLGDAGRSSVRLGVSMFYDHMGGVLPVMMDQNGSFGMTVTVSRISSRCRTMSQPHDSTAWTIWV
jgi:hypothetical protein